MKTKHYLIGLVLVLLYYVPVLVLAEGSYALIHDCLGGEFVYRLFMPHEQNGVIEQVMNGLPREMLQSDWNVTAWLCRLFPPFTAYFVNDFLARVVGFFSMALLLGELMPKRNRWTPYVVLVVAVSFAYLGSYNVYCGLTVMGQPFLFWIFIKLYRSDTRWWFYPLIVLFAFWSSFALSGIFICLSLGVWWLIAVCGNKRWYLPFLMGVVVLGLSYMVVEYQLIGSFLTQSQVSHRIEFVPPPHSLAELVNLYLKQATLLTHYHSGSLYTLPIILIALLGLVVAKRIDPLQRTLWLVVGSIIGFGFVYHALLVASGGNLFAVLIAFQWDRFYFLLPMLWLVLLALSANNLLFSRNIWVKWAALFLVVVTICGLVYRNREFRINVGQLIGRHYDEPSFGAFYDTPLFDRIARHIGVEKPTYRVVSIGMHPMVAIYNGFYTLDSYQISYPLAYKHQFRAVIAPELAQSEELRRYFDNWGVRCYLFSHELGFNYLLGKNSSITLKELSIDTEKLYQMGGRYLFSAVEIEHPEQLSLHLEGVFEGAFWRIYLYAISPNPSSPTDE